MKRHAILLLAMLGATMSAPASARSIDFDESASVSDSGDTTLPPYLQCVPYARQVSGISIYGDAHTWWDQADGHYARGYRPKVGAVMTFKPHGNSTLGHVAAVSRIVDPRTILIRHANWSPINGRRGQIEDNVRVVDVSEDNDWSEVRVWYAPIQALGGSHWPIQGFIYPGKPKLAQKGSDAGKRRMALAKPAAVKPEDPIGQLISKKLGW